MQSAKVVRKLKVVPRKRYYRDVPMVKVLHGAHVEAAAAWVAVDVRPAQVQGHPAAARQEAACWTTHQAACSSVWPEASRRRQGHTLELLDTRPAEHADINEWENNVTVWSTQQRTW